MNGKRKQAANYKKPGFGLFFHLPYSSFLIPETIDSYDLK
jgi:hypothetical protein